MNKEPKVIGYTVSMSIWAAKLENIGTPEALEAIKPFRQKQAMRRKLVRPISIFTDNRIGSSLMTLWLFGLVLWSLARRKKGDKIVWWPLLIPMAVWGMCVYEPVTAEPFPIEFQIRISFLIVTLVGVIPWLASWWRVRAQKRRKTAGDTSP
jgi:hypothetical protein